MLLPKPHLSYSMQKEIECNHMADDWCLDEKGNTFCPKCENLYFYNQLIKSL